MSRLARAATIAGAVFAVLAFAGGAATAQELKASWVARDAGSRCDPQTGHVTVYASIKNTGDLALTVTVTEVTFQGQSDTAVVPPGETHTFFFDAGMAPLPGGTVAYHVEWEGGSSDFTRGHSPTSACTTTTSSTTETHTTQTETTSTTTPGGSSTSTTPGSTTSSTTTASSTSETTTASSTSVAGTTIAPSSSTPDGTTVLGTTVSPGGTAFTGFESVVPLGGIALLLMTGGSGLLWAGARRRRHDQDDEE
jgi:hypothetical protein